MKKFFKSKTMLFSMLLTIFAALQASIADVGQLAGEHAPLVTVGIAVIVAVLRFLTTTSLADK